MIPLAASRRKMIKRLERRASAVEAPPRVLCLGIGAGGMPLGSRLAGATIVAAVGENRSARRTFARNFPGVPVFAGGRGDALPHPDVVLLSDERVGWTREEAMLASPRVVCFEARGVPCWLDGYRRYEDVVDPVDHGLPQRRPRTFVVAFRSDLNPPFLAFPFPYPTATGVTAGGILDDLPSLPGWEEKVMAAQAARAEKDFRYECQVVVPDGLFPAITPRHATNKTGIAVRAPGGLRKPTLLELRRAMGFPDDHVLAMGEKEALSVLGGDVCPPVAAALVEEIAVWLFA
jgi:site-specific DNA-cytosine methylase